MEKYLARVQVEISHVWARNNPELAVKKIVEFQTDYSATDWNHSINMNRPGFVTFMATAKNSVEATA